MSNSKASRLALFLVLGGLLTGCGSGGGGGSGGTNGFQLTQMSLQDGAVWEVNREITLTFNAPVDFATVSLNTIQIQSSSGVPATGKFSMRGTDIVVFQPNCPTREDFSDAGLQTGGIHYTIKVIGRDGRTVNTVRSTAGKVLEITQIRNFSTPDSNQASTVFLDTTLGPPVPVVRSQGSLDPNATYLEIGRNPDDRVYFELDASQNLVLSVPGFQVPLNLYSERTSAVAVVIEFNQPVNPSTGNISESRMHLEFQDASDIWRPLDTRVTLVANCTETGALVRMEPIGLLPPASQFRAIVLPGFQDLVGQTTLLPQDSFALAPTTTIQFTSLIPADEKSDEFLEGFDFGGTSAASFQDTSALFDSPEAEWGGGQLSAAFSFDGTGGPNGDFDWVVKDGDILFFDTTGTPIVGGPDGVPTTVQNAANGIVDVRNLIIEAGGEIRVQGPNPMRINATGDVRINGRLDLSGFSAKDVATLNTGNQVEIGGAGAAGGGKGGLANEVITNSTPQGGKGQGPFGQPNTGGQGGETGYAPDRPPGGKNARRPGGGGGGRFARDINTGTSPAECSVKAGPGSDGNPTSKGALDGVSPASGGAPGSGPFLDERSDNDFLGVRPVVAGGQLLALIRGELPSLWGGYGGGGGGNADPSSQFPTPNWNLGSDEKGGGGGGSAGGLHIKALGRIIFGPAGQILASGGRGGTGENTNFLDHIGATGGGGSGGHVILESATLIDFTDEGNNVAAALKDWISACGPQKKVGPTADVDNDQRGYSNGGAGGAGVIQLHVPDPISSPGTDPATSDILVPALALSNADPLDAIASPPAFAMIPTFGARSKARSAWISIGGADQRPAGPAGLVSFLFQGLQTAAGPDEGKIKTTGSTVTPLAPLLDENLEGSATVAIVSGGNTLEVRGASLSSFLNGSTSGISNDIYLRTPPLLREFVLRLDIVENPFISQDFSVADAVYEDNAGDDGGPRGDRDGVFPELRMVMAANPLGTLQDFFDSTVSLGTVRFRLIPRFLRVVTDGIENLLPSNAFVRLRFQAAADDGFGRPDAANPLVDWTGDISKFNALPAGDLQFFRFEVEFDLDAQAMGVSADTEPVTLDFLRVPFQF